MNDPVASLLTASPAIPPGAVLPNFLIVGAAKAGTTSLYEYLRQHAEVFLPTDRRRKEPTYFVNQGKIVKTFKEYLSLFAEAGESSAVGEASTAYLYAPESPALIKKALGEIKIIIVLRNPAQRAYSLWAHMVRRGHESATSFEEGLALEETRRRDPNFHRWCYKMPVLLPENFFYFRSGLYHDQVKRYFDAFGRDRVHVLIFEHLAKDPITCCREVFEFLDVDPAFRPTIEVHNQGWVPRSILLQYWAQAGFFATLPAPARRIIPKGVHNRLRGMRDQLKQRITHVNRVLGRSAKISPETYARLMESYRPEISRLEGLLGQDLWIWKMP